MSSVLRRLYAWAGRHPDQLLFAFLDGDGRTTESYTYAQFVQRTADVASHIRRRASLSPGERVLLAYPPGLEMICAFFASVRLGLVPVPVYPPAGNGFHAALAKTDVIARDCGASAVLTDRAYYWSMRLNETRHRVASLSLGRSFTSRLPWIVTSDADRGSHDTVADAHSDILFLQYTSGSTSEPKGAMVTHDNILHNCAAVVDHRPVGVSWLPQYHDMGLIGYYLYFAVEGATTYGFSPFDFIRRPSLWLETISTYRGTASSAPNFAYEYCLRADKVSPAVLEQLDLSSLRFLMTAAEPVRPDVFRAFLARFAPCGLRPESHFAAYGLAEFTLAVSNYGRTIQGFDRAALARGHVAPTPGSADPDRTTSLVSCGRPLGATEVRIVRPTSPPSEAGEHGVGEIWLRGPSKCAGYWGRPELSLAAFHARLPGDPPSEPGWLRTGDLGFIHAGELYVCGRVKDMLILRGLNYYPQDIERLVQADSRIRKGCVAAFGCERDGREIAVVVAEVRDRRHVPDAREINRRLQQGLGMTATTIVFIEARTIAKTSSGKIARHRVRERWLDGQLRVIEQVDSEVAVEDIVEGPAWAGREWLARFGLRGTETWTLADAGFDSIRLVDFAHALKQQLENAGDEDLSGAVDLRVLSKIAICELVELLDQVAAAAPHARMRFRRALLDLGDEHRAAEAEMMRHDASLRFEPAVGRRDDSLRGSGAAFLTGGTGFFGPFLLASLLDQTRDDVYVLVRGEADAAMRRIREGLEGIADDDTRWRDDWEGRIHPVCGDLASPRLGLDEQAWCALASTVDTIYHNGAVVNYLLDYSAMREATVGGTNEVVRLATCGRPKVLNHISTTFVFGWSVQPTLAECDTNERMERLDFGYSQSKWVSEQVVRDAMRRGVDARIFRPALLTPSVSGRGNNFDIAIRLLSFMVAHGLSTTARNQVSFTPADVAARNVVAISRLPESVNMTYHVTRDEYATLADVTEILAALTGKSFRYLALREFVPAVIQRCRPGDMLFPLLDFLVRSADNITAMEFKRYDNSNYRRYRAATGFSQGDPPLDDVVLGILRYMRRHNLVRT